MGGTSNIMCLSMNIDLIESCVTYNLVVMWLLWLLFGQ